MHYDQTEIEKAFNRYLETGSEEDLGTLISSCDPIIASVVFQKSSHAEDISQDIRLRLVTSLRQNPVLAGWRKDPCYHLRGLIRRCNNELLERYSTALEATTFPVELDYIKEQLKIRSKTHGCDFEKEFETWATANGYFWDKLIDWIHDKKLRDKLGREIVHRARRLKTIYCNERAYFGNVDMYNRAINGLSGGSMDPENDLLFRDGVKEFFKETVARIKVRWAGEQNKERIEREVWRIKAKIETDFGVCLDCGHWDAECSCEKENEE